MGLNAMWAGHMHVVHQQGGCERERERDNLRGKHINGGQEREMSYIILLDNV